MQNRYVGDIADFWKHGLLRCLSGHTANDDLNPLRLGLIWYMHHDERHAANPHAINRDGQHIEYLTRTPDNDRREFRDCDPDLWERLRDLVFRDARCVHCAEGAGLLPEGTRYFNALLAFPRHMRPATRREVRRAWFDAALREMADAHLVCLDPDNGLADEGRMYRRDGPKHAYAPDLAALWERGQSLVVYQHLGMVRGGAEAVMVPAAIERIAGAIPEADPIPLWFHSYGARVFFVVPRPEHQDSIEPRLERFVERWAAHVERVA